MTHETVCLTRTPERLCPPEETLARIRPHFSQLGITRLGLATGLDRVGIPVALATRPNSRSLAVHQGKGLSVAAALASAAMEAVEVSIAERAAATGFVTTLAALANPAQDPAPDWGAAALKSTLPPLMDLARLTRCQARRIPRDRDLAFLSGHDLISGTAKLVPTALVGIDHTDLDPHDPFDRSSDGLASGNTLAEAMLHGLYELIERDAVALSRVVPQAALLGKKRPIEWFAFPDLDDVAHRLAAAGLDLALFDITHDFGVPVVMALIAPQELERRPDLNSAAVCGGFACHHDIGVAAVKAAIEACQGRVTALSGARDDIGAAWYEAASGGEGEDLGLLAELMGAPAIRPPAPPKLEPRPPEQQVADLAGRLAAGRIREAVVVRLETAIDGIHVVRVLVPGLEIGPGAAGRHIGARLLGAMLRAQAAGETTSGAGAGAGAEAASS